MEMENHSIIYFGRGLWRPSSPKPCTKQGQLRVGWPLQSLSMQPVQVLDHPHMEISLLNTHSAFPRLQLVFVYLCDLTLPSVPPSPILPSLEDINHIDTRGTPWVISHRLDLMLLITPLRLVAQIDFSRTIHSLPFQSLATRYYGKPCQRPCWSRTVQHPSLCLFTEPVASS